MIYAEIALLLSSFLNLLLVCLIWSRGKKNPINIFYALTNLGAVAWGIGQAFIFFSTNASSIILFSTMTYIAGAFIAINFLIFSFYFPFATRPISKWKIAGLYLLFACLSIYLLMPGSIIRDVALKQGIAGINTFTASLSGSIVYVIYFLIIFGLSYKNLIGKYFKADGFAKSQLLYISVGVVITLLISVATNVIAPIFVGTIFGWVGPVSTLIATFFAGCLLFR